MHVVDLCLNMFLQMYSLQADKPKTHYLIFDKVIKEVLLEPIMRQIQKYENDRIETSYLTTYNFIKEPAEFQNESNRWFYDFDALSKIMNSIN
jgi:hypothetical protein